MPFLFVGLVAVALGLPSLPAAASYLRVGEVEAEWAPTLTMGFFIKREIVDATAMPNGRLVPIRTRFDRVDRYVTHRDRAYGSCIIEVRGIERFYRNGQLVTDRADRIIFRCTRE